MIARNGLTSPRKRRTVARAPMQGQPSQLPTCPAKARVPPVLASFHERPIHAPASATGPIAPSPGSRPAILSP